LFVGNTTFRSERRANKLQKSSVYSAAGGGAAGEMGAAVAHTGADGSRGDGGGGSEDAPVEVLEDGVEVLDGGVETAVWRCSSKPASLVLQYRPVLQYMYIQYMCTKCTRYTVCTMMVL
jgi:hypothetical protein